MPDRPASSANDGASWVIRAAPRSRLRRHHGRRPGSYTPLLDPGCAGIIVAGAGHAAILLAQVTRIRPGCSPQRRLFGELGLLFVVPCAVRFVEPPLLMAGDNTVAQTATGAAPNIAHVPTLAWRGCAGCPTVIPVNRGTRQYSGDPSARGA